MRIACLVAGPEALCSPSWPRKHPGASVELWDRNRAGATYGFGVVFSDEAMDAIQRADEPVHAAIVRDCAHWGQIDVHLNGASTPPAATASRLSHARRLTLMQQRAGDLGVRLHHESEAPHPDELEGYDLVVGADGVSSDVRAAHADVFEPSVEPGACKFIWLATDQATTPSSSSFSRRRTGSSRYAYPYNERESTFIVEMREEVWRRAGFERFASAASRPGDSDLESVAILKDMLAELLGGHELLANNSKWLSFPTLKVERWFHDNIVLLGDAAHTAHFSIGSATKLAVEDATELVSALLREDGVPAALVAYESARRPRGEHPARCRRERPVVRGPAAVRSPGRHPVRLQPAHTAAGSPTTTCACATTASSGRSTIGSPTRRSGK